MTHKHLVLALAVVCLVWGMIVAIGCEPATSPQNNNNNNNRPEVRPPDRREPERVKYTEDRKPCKDYDPLRRPMFGDLHVHGNESFDAWAYQTKATPDEIYKFAQGQPMQIPPFDENGKGRVIQLSRPLDFTALTEHAEFLGEVNLCRTPGNPAYDTQSCKRYRQRDSNSVILFGVQLTQEDAKPQRIEEICGKDGQRCLDVAQQRWQMLQRKADEYYDRTESCSFVTFMGYEYATTPGLSNLHRNVIFRNSNVTRLPISFYEQPSAYGLWMALKQECLDSPSGCDVMTIGHNSNLSNGRMFALMYPSDPLFGGEFAAAALRLRLEPLIEMVQHKGSMECRPGLSGVRGDPDPHCSFEEVRPEKVEDCKEGTGSLGMRLGGCVSRLDFTRHIFEAGLEEQQRIQINPYKMGVIGATDTHNGLAGYTEEYNYRGHIGTVDDTPEKQLSKGNITHDGYIDNPGGLAVVWAEERSRDAIFNALQRRETYATSGTRIVLRIFGGWKFSANLCQGEDKALVQEGYQQGAPMGANLPEKPADVSAPTFLVLALQDQGTDKHPGTPLQQIQIIKGWLDSDGKSREKVFTVAGDSNNGASVDTATCERKGKGEARLCVRWTDPEFDPQRSAFYYARVLENPTCRWSTYTCNQLPANKRPEACTDPLVPKIIQERAWSSPLWYNPKP